MSVTTAAPAATTAPANTITAAPATTTAAPVRRLVVGGLAAAAVAAAATATVAGVGEFVGVRPVVGGGQIPASGFALLTFVFSVVGLVLALVLARAARRPRTAFVRTTIVLTALSLVPDVLADAAVATKMLLMLTHLVAAAIVIPVIARRLSV